MVMVMEMKMVLLLFWLNPGARCVVKWPGIGAETADMQNFERLAGDEGRFLFKRSQIIPGQRVNPALTRRGSQ